MTERAARIAKPVPHLSEINRPFYDSARRGQFCLQRCRACGQWTYYPRIACPNCLADELEWTIASGQGSVYSFALVYRPQHPSFEDDIPIVLAAIALPEGPVMISEVVDCDSGEPYVGMPVEIVWERRSAEIAVPRFRPVRDMTIPRPSKEDLNGAARGC